MISSVHAIPALARLISCSSMRRVASKEQHVARLTWHGFPSMGRFPHLVTKLQVHQVGTWHEIQIAGLPISTVG